MEPNSENKLVRVPQGALPALAFLGEIRVLGRFGFPRSILILKVRERELNGRAWDTSGLSFVQIPSVVLEIRFRPMYTMSGLP